ncbi:MAG: hypothetical protein FJX56_11255 [Alphaproteobacteria bacterium]|nr:hypothetical protein [Alphaproteobacteria bacterium]
MRDTRRLPILVLADPHDPSQLARAFEIGAADYLNERVDPRELRLRARTQVNNKRYQDALRSL